MKSNTNLAAQQDMALLFEPDVLAPSQFQAILKSSQVSDPERRLMVAILEDAVSCLARNPRRCARPQRRAFEEAHAWVNSADTDDWVFSFANVCEMLGFDAAYLRRGLNQWTVVHQSRPGMKPGLKKYRSGTRHRKLRFRSGL